MSTSCAKTGTVENVTNQDVGESFFEQLLNNQHVQDPETRSLTFFGGQRTCLECGASIPYGAFHHCFVQPVPYVAFNPNPSPRGLLPELRALRQSLDRLIDRLEASR